jgi:hypothetical protein
VDSNGKLEQGIVYLDLRLDCLLELSNGQTVSYSYDCGPDPVELSDAEGADLPRIILLSSDEDSDLTLAARTADASCRKCRQQRTTRRRGFITD